MTDRALMTATEAAAFLSVAKRTLWTLTNTGEIPHIRIGRAIRYDPRDLDRWIQKRKRKSTGAITAESLIMDTEPGLRP